MMDGKIKVCVYGSRKPLAKKENSCCMPSGACCNLAHARMDLIRQPIGASPATVVGVAP